MTTGLALDAIRPEKSGTYPNHEHKGFAVILRVLESMVEQVKLDVIQATEPQEKSWLDKPRHERHKFFISAALIA